MSSDSVAEDQTCSQPLGVTEIHGDKEAPMDILTPPLSTVRC